VFTFQETPESDKRNFNRFYTKEPFQKKTFKEEEMRSQQEAMKSGSISVTNNEITNNNQNVSINNKMNTFIIIMNDKKQEKKLNSNFESLKKSEKEILLNKSLENSNAKGNFKTKKITYRCREEDGVKPKAGTCSTGRPRI
jgi:hypothetical protein